MSVVVTAKDVIGPEDERPQYPARPAIDAILDPERWPVPKWFRSEANGAGEAQPKTGESSRERAGRRNTGGGLKGYGAFFRHRLRSRYMELEAVFRGFVGAFRSSDDIDETTAEQIADHLCRARTLLEQEKPDPYMVSDILDLVEQYMVWVTPEQFKDVILMTLQTRLETLPERHRSRYGEELHRLLHGNGDWRHHRALVDHVTGLQSQQAKEESINRGLRVERLESLRTWGLVVLAAFLIGTPLAVNRTSITRAPGVSNDFVAVLLSGLAVVIVAAAAGYLSGLLQVRERSVDLVEYQISVLKLQLRPIVGGIVSLALFVLLSWDIVPSVNIETRGSLFLVAFLAGFSERYFLRLIEFRPDDQSEERPQISGQSEE